MALSLNGSTGISGINGNAGTPALQGGDADTGIFFGTNNAFIATGGTQRIEVDANGGLGIGNSPGTIPASARLFVNGTDLDIVHRSSNSTGTTKLFFNHDDTNYGSVGLENRKLVLRCGASSSPNAHAYVDQNGVFLKGTDTSRTNLVTASQFQVEGTGADTGSISLIRNSSGGNAAYLQLATTGGSTIGSLTATPLAAVLGQITFAGSDGAAFRGGAYITVENDNASTDSPTAWSSGDCPARLSMSTTPRGANSPLTRFEIDSAGKTLITASSASRTSDVYGIRHPLEVKSTDNASDPSGIFSNNGIKFYDTFMMSGADNDGNAAVEFEILSSTVQSYPVQFYVMITGCNRSEATPANIAAWRQYSLATYNEDVNGVRLTGSGGDSSSVGFTITNLGATTWTKGTVPNLKLVTVKIAGSTNRQETTMTVIASARLPIIRADRNSG